MAKRQKNRKTKKKTKTKSTVMNLKFGHLVFYLCGRSHGKIYLVIWLYLFSRLFSVKYSGDLNSGNI